jgi:hypothetical protein
MNRIKAFFRALSDKIVSFFTKKKKASKKPQKVVILEASGFMPAPSVDCIKMDKKYKKMN